MKKRRNGKRRLASSRRAAAVRRLVLRPKKSRHAQTDWNLYRQWTMRLSRTLPRAERCGDPDFHEQLHSASWCRASWSRFWRGGSRRTVSGHRRACSRAGCRPRIRARERRQAHKLHSAAVWLVCSGPVVWLLGGWLLRERARAKLTHFPHSQSGAPSAVDDPAPSPDSESNSRTS